MKTSIVSMGLVGLVSISCSLQQSPYGAGAKEHTIVLVNSSTVQLSQVSIAYGDTVLTRDHIPGGTTAVWPCHLLPIPRQIDCEWQLADGRTLTNRFSVQPSDNDEGTFKLQYNVIQPDVVPHPQFHEILNDDF